MRTKQTVLGLYSFLRGCVGPSLIASCCLAGEGRSNSQQAIDIIFAPPIDGAKYKCRNMVCLVNHLRSLGKTEALAALRRHLKKDKWDDRVHLVCRCLFQNPKGWTPPGLGEPLPNVSEESIEKFPAFPIAFSERVPFLLTGGYLLAGAAEDPNKSLKLCESLPLIPSDLPTQGYERAARLLVGSDQFRALYPDAATRKRMADMITKQAQEGNAQEKASGKGR